MSKTNKKPAPSNREAAQAQVGITDLVDAMRLLARRWRRQCGRPGGADMMSSHAHEMADRARRECARDVDELARYVEELSASTSEGADGTLTDDLLCDYGSEFREEDKDAIAHVEMLLTEYAWSDEPMTPAANRLKRDMKNLWSRWSKQAATVEK